jgi:hypothetical protein
LIGGTNPKPNERNHIWFGTKPTEEFFFSKYCGMGVLKYEEAGPELDQRFYQLLKSSP